MVSLRNTEMEKNWDQKLGLREVPLINYQEKILMGNLSLHHQERYLVQNL